MIRQKILVVYFYLGCDRILTWHILIEMMGKMIGEAMVGVGEILGIGETEADEADREATEECIRRYVISVGGNAKYLFHPMAVSRCIVPIVLKRIEAEDKDVIALAGEEILTIKEPVKARI